GEKRLFPVNTNPDSDLDTVLDETAPPTKPSLLAECLLAIAGLLLTIFSTFVEVFVTNPPWQWWDQGIYPSSLGTTYQVGAVLLTACIAGANAGASACQGRSIPSQNGKTKRLDDVSIPKATCIGASPMALNRRPQTPANP
ncbi:MAG: BioY protein, partial [Pseudomonadota bacterium]